jgi:hypothetical protein
MDGCDDVNLRFRRSPEGTAARLNDLRVRTVLKHRPSSSKTQLDKKKFRRSFKLYSAKFDMCSVIHANFISYIDIS